jgi:hypothetical protein
MWQHNPHLLQALKAELDFFRSGGYGRAFRGGWRPTLLFRDSPTCTNFTSVGALNPCRECPLFPLVPSQKRNYAIPCHYIVLDADGATIARLYQSGSQKALDQSYSDWLLAVIAGLEQPKEAA